MHQIDCSPDTRGFLGLRFRKSAFLAALAAEMTRADHHAAPADTARDAEFVAIARAERQKRSGRPLERPVGGRRRARVQN